jgi:hypothetical protein
MRLRVFQPLLATGILLLGSRAHAAIPGAEQLLPQDTLLMVTTPDFGRMRDIYRTLPRARLWADPAMKPLKDRFTARWQDEFVKPLERELNVNFGEYASLPQGQLTFALTKDAWKGNDEHPVGFLLLLDTRDRTVALRTNLADLRKNWVNAGRNVRREQIRGVEFSVYPIASNNLPATLRKFFPEPYQFQAPPGQVGSKAATADALPKFGPLFDAVSAMISSSADLYVGQFESMLIVGNSLTNVDKVVARLTGSAMPSLAELPSFQANYVANFRDAPLYGWLNAQLLVETLSHKPPDKDADAADSADGPPPGKVLEVTGLLGVKSAAFTFQASSEGSLLQFVITAPDSARRGFFKILAGESKEVGPPPFVPADATQYWRWRLDGQKTWSALEAMLSEGSPQTLTTLNWILDTAAARAKELTPGFDLRKSLLASLGDDWIRFTKPPRDNTPADLASPPALLLIGSPAPQQLASALKALFVIFPEGDTMSEREFLGRKITSVPLPDLPVAIPGASRSAVRRNLNFAAGASYVAISTDAALLEEFLRSSDNPEKGLREIAGFPEAAQKAGGPGTSLLMYENSLELTRAAFDSVKRFPAAVSDISGLNPLPGLSVTGDSEKGGKTWLEPALLPPFDKVSSYFFFTVYSLSSNTDSLTFKIFTPTPPGLRQIEASRK